MAGLPDFVDCLDGLGGIRQIFAGGIFGGLPALWEKGAREFNNKKWMLAPSHVM